MAETVDRLERAIRLNPAIRIFARIDQARLAAEGGGHIAPMVELLFENVRFAHQIIEVDPEGAFNLPIKALIWQEDAAVGSRVWLRTTDPNTLDPQPTGGSTFTADIEAILGEMIDRAITPRTRYGPSFTCCSPPAGTPPDVAGHESSRVRTPHNNHPGEKTVGVMTIRPVERQRQGIADLAGVMTTRQGAAQAAAPGRELGHGNGLGDRQAAVSVVDGAAAW